MCEIRLRNNFVNSSRRVNQAGQRLALGGQNHVSALIIAAGNFSAPGDSTIGKPNKTFRPSPNCPMRFSIEQRKTQVLRRFQINAVKVNSYFLLTDSGNRN